MSKIGDMIDEFDAEFAEWMEDPLEVTNYTRVESTTGDDEWDDPDEKQATADSPIQTTGQVDSVAALAESEPWGREIDADVVIFVDDDVTISAGQQTDLPYSSDVHDLRTDVTYRVSERVDEGNGVIRCAGTTIARGDD